MEPIAFTTTAIRRNFALENGLIAKEIRVVNDDTTNACTVRLHSRGGRARTVPASSDVIIRQWVSEIHVEPNAVSGEGLIEVALVRLEDARRNS